VASCKSLHTSAVEGWHLHSGSMVPKVGHWHGLATFSGVPGLGLLLSVLAGVSQAGVAPAVCKE
jgi:hypothetical protein